MEREGSIIGSMQETRTIWDCLTLASYRGTAPLGCIEARHALIALLAGLGRPEVKLTLNADTQAQEPATADRWSITPNTGRRFRAQLVAGGCK